MPARGVSDVTVVIAAGIALAVLVTVGALIAPAPNATDGGTSTYSAGRRGTKAAYLVLLELGYRVERSLEPITAIHAEPAATVLVLSGPEEPSDQDRRALQRFLENGGIVLAAGANGADFLGLKVVDDAEPAVWFDETIETFRAVLPAALSAGAARITMPADIARPAIGGSYVTVYGKSVDEPVVATAKVGQGRAVWWAATTPMSNAHIDKEDNLRLFLNVVGAAGARLVVFDEHYQGHRRSIWSYAAGTPLPWVALQVGLIAGAVFFTHARRHGPVRARRTDARTSPMEFVDMLGALYERGRARNASVSAARARFRRTVATACGVPVAGTDDVLARAAASKLATSPGPIEQLLAESARAAADPGLDAARALDLVRRLQAETVKLKPSNSGLRRE